MQEYHSTISSGGRVVIPADFRKELGLDVGSEVIVRLEEDGIKVTSMKQAIAAAQKLAAHYTKGTSLVQQLKQMRMDDAAHE